LDQELKPEDSRPATKEHILEVSKALNLFCQELLSRALDHDNSKLNSPELALFDKYTPLLKSLVYGCQEYKDSLTALKPALDHHYQINQHHPEHFPNGVDDMCLVDLIEMFCDWSAASKRTKDGSMDKSIEIGCKRFEICDQLKNIFYNSTFLLE
jgi:hypothetical protein